MMDRPPWASPFIRDTTWKQEALSRPLQVKEPHEMPADPTLCPPPKHRSVCKPEPRGVSRPRTGEGRVRPLHGASAWDPEQREKKTGQAGWVCPPPEAAGGTPVKPWGRGSSHRSPEYLVGSSKNMTGGLFTSSSAMARRFRWPPERLPVRVLAQDSRPRAVRISLTWGQRQSQSGPQGRPATPRPTGPTWAPAASPARLPDTHGRARASRPPQAARFSV